MRINKKAITIVELIVVITILSILGTIGFISLQNYTIYSRDVVRVADLGSISRVVSIKIVEGGYAPKPENPIEITSSGTLVMYQGIFTARMGKRYGINGNLVDPLDGKNYTYTTDSNLFKHELAGFLEGETLAVNLTKESHAGVGRKIVTKGDKLGIVFTPEEIPLQEERPTGDTLDIVQTTDTYKVYFDDDDYIEGDGSVLFKINPRASCERLFELGGSDLGSGEYQVVNPHGEELKVFCDVRFQDKTFYSTIEDGHMENLASTNWDGYSKSTEESYSGSTSLKFVGRINPVSNNYTYIQPGKRYTLEGMFKSAGTFDGSLPRDGKSRIYYGFREFDENFQPILHYHVHNIEGTETVLTQDIVASDTTIYFSNIDGGCTTDNLKWKYTQYFNSYTHIAFEIDDSGAYNDLPNRNLSTTGGFLSISENAGVCQLTLNQTIGKNYPAGTKIRRHNRGGTYNYIAASSATVPNTWTKFSGEIKGPSINGASNEYFRRGTKFIKIHMLANYQQTNAAILYVDNLKLVEY